MTIARTAAAGLLLAAGVAGCSGGSDDRCLSAFRNVDPRALPPYGASPLDDAVKSCRTVAEWSAAWDAVPAAHEGRTDALSFLEGRCAVQALASTAICNELATAS